MDNDQAVLLAAVASLSLAALAYGLMLVVTGSDLSLKASIAASLVLLASICSMEP